MKTSNTKIAYVVQCVVLYLFAFLLLGIAYGNYLRKLESLSIFLPTSQFWHDCMLTPGGALSWAGCYLTQYFYHPWIGAAIFSILLLALFVLIIKVFQLHDAWSGIAAIPSAMMMLWLLLPGYVIFSLRTSGYAYSGLLGLLACTLLYGLYTSISKYWVRTLILLIYVLAGYPLLGVYALLLIALCAIYEIKTLSIGGYILASVALVLSVVYPYFYFRHEPTVLTPSQIYIAGMPNIMPEEWGLWAPFVIAAIAMLFYSAMQGLWRDGSTKISQIIGYGIFVASLASVVVFRYTDPNFKASIDLDRALSDGDWPKAAERARALDVEPTRLNTLYTYIALLRMGTAQDAMFTYPVGCAPYVSSRESNAMRDAAGMMVSYHFGRPNNAYRWAMEYKVEYGLKVEYLKYMAKCALLNGEYPLARKYLETLAKTKYHKAWAEKYLTYADDPRLISTDPEMSLISPLMLFKDHIGGDGGKIETYLIPVLSALGGGTPELQNLSLLCNLIQKDIDLFMKKYGNKARGMRDIPRHYQEAILTYSMVHQAPVYKQFNISPMVMQRFDQFMHLNRMHINKSREEIIEILQPLFGDTYWYYFFYAPELKTN